MEFKRINRQREQQRIERLLKEGYLPLNNLVSNSSYGMPAVAKSMRNKGYSTRTVNGYHVFAKIKPPTKNQLDIFSV